MILFWSILPTTGYSITVKKSDNQSTKTDWDVGEEATTLPSVKNNAKLIDLKFVLLSNNIFVVNCNKSVQWLLGHTLVLKSVERNNGNTLGDGNSLKWSLAAKSWLAQSCTPSDGPNDNLASWTLVLSKQISVFWVRPRVTKPVSTRVQWERSVSHSHGS